MSKYKQLYGDLADRIRQGEYKAGDWLPSEPSLMEQYGASRDTVRKALGLLAEDGYIQKEHGKGSLVLKIETESPLQDLAAYPYLPDAPGMETVLKSVKRITPTRELASNMGFDKKRDLYKIVRIRRQDGQTIVLETDYTDADLIGELDMESAKEPLWQIAYDRLHQDIGFSRKEITLRPSRLTEAQQLKLEVGQPLVVVRSWTYLEDARQLQYTVAKHHPDKFRYTDFLRKKKSR